MNAQSYITGVVTGTPKWVLRAEGALVLAVATYAYNQTHMGWLLFAILFFAPDVFMLGYLKSNRSGAIFYNIGHTYLVPAAALGMSWVYPAPLISAIALIWIGHVGFDRMLGYGLKYAAGFKTSHLSSPII